MSPSDRYLAILFADVAGSTEMTVELGDAASVSIIKKIQDDLETMTRQTSGRIIKRLGDGILAVYTDPQQAASATVAMQRKLLRDYGSQGLRASFKLRMGLHYGPVEPQPDGDVLGGAVNAAQRVSSAAAPGSVAISVAVADMLRSEPKYEFHSIGFHLLKGAGNWELFDLNGAPPPQILAGGLRPDPHEVLSAMVEEAAMATPIVNGSSRATLTWLLRGLVTATLLFSVGVSVWLVSRDDVGVAREKINRLEADVRTMKLESANRELVDEKLKRLEEALAEIKQTQQMNVNLLERALRSRVEARR